MSKSPSSGVVYLVGAGPGGPGLLTLRGRECLAEAEVVLYDYLVNPRLLEWAAEGAELVCLGGHGGRSRIWSQDEITRRLIELAQAGRRVVRLKSGDPVVFARGAEEAEALAEAGVRIEIVPGVTAALAAGGCAGIPLTDRHCASAVALVTGQQRGDQPEPFDYRALARFPGTLAIYMGVTTAEHWAGELMAGGLAADTPAALVRRVSFPDQRTWTGRLDELAGHIRETKLRPPVIALIGPAARRRPALNWFESLPLFGQRVLVTRPDHQAADLARPLEQAGAAVETLPAIEIMPPDDWSDVDRSIAQLDDRPWDWIVFSSANGVRSWIDRLLQSRDLRALGPARLAAIGSKTAEQLERYHLRADLVPEEFRAEALAEALCENVAQAARVLLIRASRGREVLAEQLRAAGAEVTQVVAYRSVDAQPPDEAWRQRMQRGEFQWTTVTSSAIARSLHVMFGDALRHTQLASISPVTTATLGELGLEAATEATVYTMEGVVEAIRAPAMRVSARPDEDES